MSNIDRAKQFLPFDALKGYYKLVKNSEIIDQEKIELDEDGIKQLLFKLNQIKKGMMVKVIHYVKDHYEIEEGLVSKIDFQLGIIYIVKTKIYISNIIDIDGEDIVREEFIEI